MRSCVFKIAEGHTKEHGYGKEGYRPSQAGIPGRASGSDIVKQCQHNDPDHVHKVPVEGDILQGDVVRWSEAMSESLAKETPDDERYADGNVEAVESGDEKKLEP